MGAAADAGGNLRGRALQAPRRRSVPMTLDDLATPADFLNVVTFLVAGYAFLRLRDAALPLRAPVIVLLAGLGLHLFMDVVADMTEFQEHLLLHAMVLGALVALLVALQAGPTSSR